MVFALATSIYSTNDIKRTRNEIEKCLARFTFIYTVIRREMTSVTRSRSPVIQHYVRNPDTRGRNVYLGVATVQVFVPHQVRIVPMLHSHEFAT